VRRFAQMEITSTLVELANLDLLQAEESHSSPALARGLLTTS